MSFENNFFYNQDNSFMITNPTEILVGKIILDSFEYN